MGVIQPPRSVLLVLAAFSCEEAAFAWTRTTACAAWGPIALESDSFDFSETDYYTSTMGGPLRMRLYAFTRLVDPATLPQVKCRTNEWEETYRQTWQGRGAGRPLNLDPGYLTEAKLVLASTKDHAHRIYLSHGIYAEITLQYRAGAWQACDWTYPNYRRPDYQRFFDQCRTLLRERRKSDNG